MKTKILYDAINVINKISNEEWLLSLDTRKIKELEFHDRHRDYTNKHLFEDKDIFERFYGNKKYYQVTIRSKNYVSAWIKNNSREKVFLDYACGDGLYAIEAAKCGAELSIGIDISRVSVNNARNAAAAINLKNVEFIQADAEKTMLPDNSIDSIICSGMLHHLDLDSAYPELFRILKPGGRILAIEALDYNPIIKLYRVLTPQMRTEWEKAHILSLKDLRHASQYFNVMNIKYWHVIGYVAGKFPLFKVPLDVIDRVLEKIPYINLMAWTFTFEMVKSKSE